MKLVFVSVSPNGSFTVFLLRGEDGGIYVEFKQQNFQCILLRKIQFISYIFSVKVHLLCVPLMHQIFHFNLVSARLLPEAKT